MTFVAWTKAAVQ